MDNLFFQYMMERGRQIVDPPQKPGPVITLSREYGCYATRIAQLLAARLTSFSEAKPDGRCWTWFSNEILTEAAQKLETDPSSIAHIFGAEERDLLLDIIDSFSVKKYVSDSYIKHTITTVVRSYAEKGNAIIVGRAGCVITKDIEQSVHVRLIAPIDWRVKHIRDRFKVSESAAHKMIAENDEKRRQFMKFFRGDLPDADLFDAVMNRGTMSEDEIVESIIGIVKARKLV